MAYKIFTINPGSTSTKLGLFENEKPIAKENVFHERTLYYIYLGFIGKFVFYQKQESCSYFHHKHQLLPQSLYSHHSS